MSDLEYLIDILESSVERHGEKPLTNRWLLSIVKMAKRHKDQDEQEPEWDWLTREDIC